MIRFRRSKLFGILAGCLLLTGCAPGIQSVSIASGTATNVVSPNVDWAALTNALKKSDDAAIYRLQTEVSIQNTSFQTHFTVFGTVLLPDTASIQIHENNFNVSMYQQGQVAYVQDGKTWTEQASQRHLGAYQGYDQVVRRAVNQGIKLEQMNRTFVVDEYCNVYRMTIPYGSIVLPDYLKHMQGVSSAAFRTPGSAVEYTFYVGESTGFIRQIQTQSVSLVTGVGPMNVSSSTIFSNINNQQIAKSLIPTSLVQQLKKEVN